jgi:hypothetical protein
LCSVFSGKKYPVTMLDFIWILTHLYHQSNECIFDHQWDFRKKGANYFLVPVKEGFE